MFILHHNKRNIKYLYNNQERVIFFLHCKFIICFFDVERGKTEKPRARQGSPNHPVVSPYLVTLTSTWTTVLQQGLHKSLPQSQFHIWIYLIPVKLLSKYTVIVLTSCILASAVPEEKLCQGPLLCFHLISTSQTL